MRATIGNGLTPVQGDGELSGRSRLHLYIFMKGALRQAVVQGLGETNPTEGVARPEQSRRTKKDVLSAKEAGAYLVPRPRHRAGRRPRPGLRPAALRARRLPSMVRHRLRGRQENIRHTRACLLIEAGVDLYTVSRRLARATTAVTELHYVDPPERADEAADEALGDLRLLAPGAER
jgi:hypothetical protein